MIRCRFNLLLPEELFFRRDLVGETSSGAIRAVSVLAKMKVNPVLMVSRRKNRPLMISTAQVDDEDGDDDYDVE